jgi:uncharacterized protein with von Willebrand factor type A (vWA) domain
VSDPSALLRAIDHALWALRREGFNVSTSQAVTAAKAVEALGLESAFDVREALAAVVVSTPAERPRFDRAMGDFFRRAALAERDTMWSRLTEAGFGPDELSALRELLEVMGAQLGDELSTLERWLSSGSEIERLWLPSSDIQQIDAHAGPQLGFLGHRLVRRAGGTTARKALATLRLSLRAALGARGDALADALARELQSTEDALRRHVRDLHRARIEELMALRADHPLRTAPLATLDDDDMIRVTDAVRRLASRLGAKMRLRVRRAARGPVDAHETLRRSMKTFGVPLRPGRRRRHVARPRVVLLCDVSDSVRSVAGLLLQFVYAAHELFSRARSFVFVSDLGETTALFETQSPASAKAQIWSGAIVPTGHNSNYGRVLRSFEARHRDAVDRSTTLIILGDGRNNYFDPAVEVLERLARRARRVLWLATEPRGQWGQRDSAMALYAAKVTEVLEVSTLDDLERAVHIVARA